ncbi:MAG: prolyl oligopeptidase family serine peptidase [Chloroflexota bacterium]|nr:prolyl oligopeptidase family serine peptidase [Chloroflexota bacterium]
MPERTIAPYGSWKSPVTSDLIAGGSVRLGHVALDDGNLYWLESRPNEAGRSVLVRRGPDGTVENVTQSGSNVRTRVHEYGGGSYLIRGDTVYYADFANQMLHRKDKGDDAFPISPEPAVEAGLRYADMRLTPDGRTLVAVQEEHDGTSEAVNSIVALPAIGTSEPVTIARGRDFYAFPRVSPDGRTIAWIEWDHPNMPWDGTELWVADLASDGSATNPRQIAGGPQESIFQPAWSPAGLLHFISDRTGWWNLYRVEVDGAVTPLAPVEAEIGQPQWVFDMASYIFISAGRIACVVNENGVERLGIITPGIDIIMPLDTPFTAFGHIASDGGDRLALLAGGPAQQMSVVLLDLSGETAEIEIVQRGNDTQIDPGYLSPAQPIEFPTGGSLTAHALYYAPVNRDFEASEGELPPLLVISHGGPTGASGGELDLSIQFWTSCGIAVVDVNYGGSTGYGRAYRERLKGNWGIVDVEDCANAARYLAQQGLADSTRLAIRGGSAGGYTTLAALAFTDLFAAGASYYGVADLELLAKETHKFESRYLDGLVGPYPEARDAYIERSPLHHTDRLSSPMIIFQGLEDKVVPPSQAEALVAALAAKGLPYAYLAYEGEQHGFRRAENIKRSLDAELYFYGRIFGFTPADEIEPVTIENL